MNKNNILYALVFLFSINIVSAACTINDKEVPCSEFFKSYGLLFIVIPIFIILWMIFVIKMFKDIYKKMSEDPDTFDSNWSTKWILITSFTATLGLFVYYFAVYRKYKNKTPIPNKEMINTNSISANHFRKLHFPWNFIINILFFNFLNPYGYADGGKLLFANNKIIFKPHGFNAPGGKLEINLSEIKDYKIEKGATEKVRNVIIRTKEKEEKFVIWEKQANKFIERLKKVGI